MMSIIRNMFNKLQMPEYEVTDKNEKNQYEVRAYRPSVWVSTSQDLIDPDQLTISKKENREMFYKLFNYISGKNEGEKKIEMTVPVTREYIPGQGPACETKMTMSFYVPREFADDPPKPTAADVFISRQPAIKVFVRTFGGFANDARCMEEMQKFLPVLEQDGHTVRDDVYFFAGYDSPWKMINRRNEVWLVKKEKEKEEVPVSSLPGSAATLSAPKTQSVAGPGVETSSAVDLNSPPTPASDAATADQEKSQTQ